jgi:hypothetical protein
MKKNILNLKGASLLTKKQQKSIVGGADFVKYDPDDPCQNWTEIVPTGCPCSSQFSCSSVYYQDGSDTQLRDGVCVNGRCA